jgi:hypothetical protein
MRRARDIERLIRNMDIDTNAEVDKKVLDRVVQTQEKSRSAAPRPGVFRVMLASRMSKLAAAAILLVGVGYIVGRASAPPPLDAEQLRASLKSSLGPAIHDAVLAQLEPSLAARDAQLKDELGRQVRRDLSEFAVQTLGAWEALTDQRLTELVQLIEAARLRDRWRVASALEQIELSRLEDKTQFGNSLQRLAAQTSEFLPPEDN